MLVLVSLLMAWEWGRLCGGARFEPPGVALIMIIGLALILSVAGHMREALFLIPAGVLLVYLLGLRCGERSPSWLALGIVYIAVPCMALLWLRSLPGMGWEVVFWILGVVWATDTGAYCAGVLVGGPKLAPQISPNKTWAGLAGGFAMAALVSGLLVGLTEVAFSLWPLVYLGAFLALVEQMGDLFESFVKRHFGVKDTSRLIPGHGGVLDRLDGLLVVSPVAVAFLLLMGDKIAS
jgi:phosphatidate cytidylyltransferase